MKAHYHEGLRCTSVLLATLLSGAALAAPPVSYSIGVGAGYSDNIARTSTNEQSETMGTAELQLGVSENTRKLTADLAADLAYFEYFDNTYDAEVIGNLQGVATVRIVPERFNWVFEDNFGQVRTDPLAAVTPDNRENINYFTTGPDFFLRLGNSNRLQMAGRYSSVAYETTPQDNERYSGLLSLIHDFSAASALSGNVQKEKVKVDQDSTGADYDREQAYASYSIDGSRTHANLDAGYTRIKPDGGEDSDGALLRVDLARRMSSSATARLQFGREFSDSGNVFRLQQGLGAADLQTQIVAQTSAPFVSRYATVGLDWSRARTGLGFAASYFDESYEQQATQDVTRTQGSVYLSRRVSANFSVRLGGIYAENNYENVAGDYREVSGFGQLSWRLGSKLWLELEYDRFDRSSDLAGSDSKENRAWLRLRFGDEIAIPTPSAFSQTQTASTI